MSTRSAEALRRVLALALFVACGACGVLGIDTTEKPLEVRYAGNDAFSDGELDDVLDRFFKDFADARFKKSAVDDAAFDIERAYLAAGYSHVRVDYTFDEAGREKPLATFTIEEGPRVEFAGVTFRGASAFTAAELQAFFTAPATGLFEESRTAWVESDVRSAASELELAYATRGFIAARVEVERVEFDADRTRATAHVRIDEGVQCRIRSITITGADPRIDAQALDAAKKRFIGVPYFERLSIEIQGRIDELCASVGFGDVRVTRSGRTVTPDGHVDLAFTIEPGPRITIGAIRIAGNESTQTDFIRSRVELNTGEAYSREKERTSIAHLYRSGVFDRVSVRPVVAPDEDASSGSVTRDVKVDVIEGTPIETFLEPGYGSYEGLRLTAGARHKNLFGTGRILDFQGTVAQRALRGELSLIDPWFLESDDIADLSLFGNRREEPSFLRLEAGVSATLTRRFSRTLEGSVGYRYRNSAAEDVEVLDSEAQEALDRVDISAVETSFALDTRDSVFVPKSGSYTKAGLEYAASLLGSELDFARIKVQHATFVALNEAMVLGASAEFGLIYPLADTVTIPLQERFFNGGENSVRSFDESELGPKDAQGEPLGGEAFTTFSVELRRRLRGRLEGALFYDLGNVTEHHGDVLEFEGYGQAIGAGLRYNLPVGPVRVDFAVNPAPKAHESDYQVHVSLGFAF